MVDKVEPVASDRTAGSLLNLLEEIEAGPDKDTVFTSLAEHLAARTGAAAFVAVLDSQGQGYDVWLGGSTEGVTKLNWVETAVGFASLLSRQTIASYEKLEQPAAEIMRSPLWLLVHRQVLLAQFNKESASLNAPPQVVVGLLDPPLNAAHYFDDLGTIALLASVLHERVELRQKVSRQSLELEVISSVSRALSSTLDVQQIYQQLSGPIQELLDVETFSIALVDPITHEISFVEQLLGPRFESLPPVRLKRGQGIAGWVAEHQEPVIINDTYADKRFFAGVDKKSGFRTRSMICLPLIVDNKTIGVLQAINRRQGRFEGHDLALLQAISGPLAVAIVNTNLERERRSEQHRLEAIFAELNDALLLVTRDGVISRANRASHALIGASDDLVGSRLSELLRLRETDVDELVARLFTVWDESMIILADVVRTDRQPLPVMISGSAISHKSGTADEALLILSDLTIAREIEHMRADLLDGVVRELWTPLATILLYARLLRGGKVRQPEKTQRFLGVIERESDRLQTMLYQMRDLMRLNARELQQRPEPMSLNAILDEVLPRWADKAVGKGLLFRQRIDPDLPAILSSPAVCYLVLNSLLDNAIKYTPSGSVQLTVTGEDDYVKLQIADEGIGIPPEALPHIYKPFYRTQTAVERSIGGNGLGLFMVKAALANYNGRIAVESEPGKGTQVTVSLPVAKT